jgi:hypothetical protein
MRYFILLLIFLVLSICLARNEKNQTAVVNSELNEPEVLFSKPHPTPRSSSSSASVKRAYKVTSHGKYEDEDDTDDVKEDYLHENIDNIFLDEDENENEFLEQDEVDTLNIHHSSRNQVSSAFANIAQHCSWPGERSKPIPFSISNQNTKQQSSSSNTLNNNNTESPYASWIKVKGFSNKGAFLRLDTMSYLFADIQFYFVDGKGKDINSADISVATSLTQPNRDEILNRWYVQLMKRRVKVGGTKRPLFSTEKDASLFFRSLFKSFSISQLFDPVGILQHHSVKKLIALPYVLLRELFEGFGAEMIFDFFYTSILFSAEKIYVFLSYIGSLLSDGFYASSFYSNDGIQNNPSNQRSTTSIVMNPFESLSYILVRRVNSTSGLPSSSLISPTGYRCQVNPLAFRYPLFLFAGLILFDKAESLITNTYAIYAGGFAFSITIVLLVLVYVFYKAVNDRRFVLPAIGTLLYGSYSGQPGSQYNPINLLRYLGFDEVADIVSEYYPVFFLLLVWVLVFLMVSLKKIIPTDDAFLMQSITYGLRFLGLCLMLNSSNVTALGVLIIILYALVQIITAIFYKGFFGIFSSTAINKNEIKVKEIKGSEGHALGHANAHLHPNLQTSQTRTPLGVNFDRTIPSRGTSEGGVASGLVPPESSSSTGFFSFLSLSPSPSPTNIVPPSQGMIGRSSLGGVGGQGVGHGGQVNRHSYGGSVGGVRDPSPRSYTINNANYRASTHINTNSGQHIRRASIGNSPSRSTAISHARSTVYESNLEDEGEGLGDWQPSQDIGQVGEKEPDWAMYQYDDDDDDDIVEEVLEDVVSQPHLKMRRGSVSADPR